jgi:hypothetical protein
LPTNNRPTITGKKKIKTKANSPDTEIGGPVAIAGVLMQGRIKSSNF